jgi:hypothetical protein
VAWRCRWAACPEPSVRAPVTLLLKADGPCKPPPLSPWRCLPAGARAAGSSRTRRIRPACPGSTYPQPSRYRSAALWPSGPRREPGAHNFLEATDTPGEAIDPGDHQNVASVQEFQHRAERLASLYANDQTFQRITSNLAFGRRQGCKPKRAVCRSQVATQGRTTRSTHQLEAAGRNHWCRASSGAR